MESAFQPGRACELLPGRLVFVWHVVTTWLSDDPVQLRFQEEHEDLTTSTSNRLTSNA